MEADVADWDHKPKFWCRYAVGWKKWWIAFGYDKRSIAGMIYGFVDDGTGLNAGKGPLYPITPVVASVLHFKVPTPVKTTPGIVGIGPAIVTQQRALEQAAVLTELVMHPGITPRNFSKSLKNVLNSRTRIGGLRSTTDAAVKRGLRKLSR